MKKLFIPVICAAALTFTGCINDFNEDDFVNTTPEMMKSVSVEGDLANKLRITQTSKMKTEKGIEVVCVRARLKRENLKEFVMNPSGMIDISYKFVWTDAKGKECAGSKWQTISLKPGSEFACTSSAPAKGISNVKLILRKKGEKQAAPAAVKKAPAKQKNAAVKQAPKAKNSKTDCLCGCAKGEKCYCPEGSACPNAGKNKKK